MKFSLAGIILALTVAIICPSNSFGGSGNWTVVVQDQTRPAQVGVTLQGTQKPSWRVDSIWQDNIHAAWKKACWLVMKGDLTGRRYVAPQIQQGRVTCDANCNCRF